MPYARTNGVRIRYETEGSGPPLLLHTGFGGTLEDWVDNGYVAPLRDRYTVLLLDPRGQGQSDKPHDPAAYSDRLRVADVLAVLDAEGIERVHFWGYSLGAGVGYWVALAAPERLHTLIAGGVNPFPPDGRPVDTDEGIVALQAGMPALAAKIEADDPDCWVSPGKKARFLANDADALIAARTKRLTERNLTETDVATIRTPALVYVGADDDPAGAERAAALMPNATFVLLDGLDHSTAAIRADLVLPHALTFLSSTVASEDGKSTPSSFLPIDGYALVPCPFRDDPRRPDRAVAETAVCDTPARISPHHPKPVLLPCRDPCHNAYSKTGLTPKDWNRPSCSSSLHGFRPAIEHLTCNWARRGSEHRARIGAAESRLSSG